MTLIGSGTQATDPETLALGDVNQLAIALLTTSTESKHFVFIADLANLNEGETIHVSCSIRHFPNSIFQEVYGATYLGKQALPIKISPVIASMFAFKAEMQQQGGTSRQIPWAVYALD